MSEDLRAVVERALFEGANPRGFTGVVRDTYLEMQAEKEPKAKEEPEPEPEPELPKEQPKAKRRLLGKKK